MPVTKTGFSDQHHFYPDYDEFKVVDNEIYDLNTDTNKTNTLKNDFYYLYIGNRDRDSMMFESEYYGSPEVNSMGYGDYFDEKVMSQLSSG